MLKNKYLKLISIIILISFLSAYYISNSGYYEYRMQERTILTNEKIKEFEQDVKNKENIDIVMYGHSHKANIHKKEDILSVDLAR